MGRLLTRVHQIEVTTQCNLACVYCPHRTMKRNKVHMDMQTFYRAIEWVKYYALNGYQEELALTGIGEGLMHPQFEDMLRYARSQYNGLIHFSTNGLLFTRKWAELCESLSVGVYVSMHRPEVAVPAKMLAQEHGILLAENHAFVDSAFDWAGTVNWYNSAPHSICRYQRDGWGVVLVDGSITTCCMDSEAVSRIGHVNDRINSAYMEPKPLCAQCHLEVQEVLEKINED